MRFHLEGITNVETVDVTEARNFFEESTGFKTGDELYDSAVEYFGTMFLQSIDYKHKYRAKRSEVLSYMSLEEAEAMAEGYQRMFERVLDARRFLEVHAETLVAFWQASENGLKRSYTDVLADIVSNSPDFIEKYSEDDDTSYNRGCFNAIQMLDGWLRHERFTIDQAEKFQAYGDLRSIGRQLLFTLGISSNPGFSDRNIVDELRKRASLEPLKEYDETPELFARCIVEVVESLGGAIDKPELADEVASRAVILVVDQQG